MADPWLAGQLAQVSWGNPLALSAAVDLVQHILRRGLAAELFAWSIARHGAAWRWAFGVLGAGAPVSVAVRLFMPESRVWLTTYRVPPASVSVLVYLALIAIFASFPVFGGRSERRGRRRCSAAAGAFGTLGYAAYAWALLTGVYGAYGAQMSPMVLGLLLWMVAGAGYLGGAGGPGWRRSIPPMCGPPRPTSPIMWAGPWRAGWPLWGPWPKAWGATPGRPWSWGSWGSPGRRFWSWSYRKPGDGPCARRWVGRRKCCRNDRGPGGDREAS
ncbi:MAG: hypothetical protein M0031_14705 [Thermaerobacter sp.]|nr:hypothetical protein [Thermaerobacter sp.]